jgi:hypothetical protein
MTAPIVYSDTRRPYDPRHLDDRAPYLSDADRRTRRAWPRVQGQLWYRVRTSPISSTEESI